MSIEDQIINTTHAAVNQAMALFVKEHIAPLLDIKTYSIKEAAKETGITERKINEAIQTNLIKSFKDGKSIRVKHSDLLRLIDSLAK